MSFKGFVMAGRKYQAVKRGECGVCKGHDVTDLSHGRGEPSIHCHGCGAHYWRKWYTSKDWETHVNAPD